jgi:hypothetical protein
MSQKTNCDHSSVFNDDNATSLMTTSLLVLSRLLFHREDVAAVVGGPQSTPPGASPRIQLFCTIHGFEAASPLNSNNDGDPHTGMLPSVSFPSSSGHPPVAQVSAKRGINITARYQVVFVQDQIGLDRID